jgi:hypothetical protein
VYWSQLARDRIQWRAVVKTFRLRKKWGISWWAYPAAGLCFLGLPNLYTAANVMTESFVGPTWNDWVYFMALFPHSEGEDGGKPRHSWIRVLGLRSYLKRTRPSSVVEGC